MMFKELNEINVSDKTEKKGGLTYLPWAYAWQTLKLHYPEAQYTVYENSDGLNYHHDNITAWVKVGVTVDELEHIEYLPVMDFRNKSITVDKLTSFDVNKAIKRALVKAIAMHGLGITIYAGEDLPEQPTQQQPAKQPASNGKVDDTQRKPTAGQMKNFHAMGTKVYGDAWDDKRPEIVKSVTKNRATSSNHLTLAEWQTLMDGMTDKLNESLFD